MIWVIWHFFKLPYLLADTFWPKLWRFFVLRTWHPWTLGSKFLAQWAQVNNPILEKIY